LIASAITKILLEVDWENTMTMAVSLLVEARVEKLVITPHVADCYLNQTIEVLPTPFHTN
jgi:hypothetical protein